jgi:DNA modification methylase
VKPYFQDKWVTIYHGSCLEILPELEVKADIVVTSPQYNVGLDYGHTDKLPLPEFQEQTKDWSVKLFDACAENSRMYIAVGEQMLWWYKPMAEDIGWKYAQLLVWCKTNICTTSKISGDWNYMTDWFLEMRKGKRTTMRNDTEGVTTFNWFAHSYPQSNTNERKQHPAQWPLALPMRYIARTPGDIVLDPFMGSGSAIVAAKMCNRKAIGIEIEEKNCAIAADRLSQEVMQIETINQEVMELNV